MKGYAAFLALLIASALSARWLSTFGSELNPPIESKTLESGEKAAGASLIGQFRTSAAANLYARTDLYLHGGVELRPMTEGEAHRGVRNAQVDTHQAHQLGSEENLVTAIPPPDMDWRGFIGQMDRDTGAYKDMHGHTHNDPQVTFPLFRLMTWVDPQFITGWTTGSMMLSDQRTPEEALLGIDFLKQGLAANPESVDILTRIGVLYAQQRGEVDQGLQYFERALEIIRAGKVGPADEDAVRETFRWLVISYNAKGDRRRLTETVAEGLKRFPDDQVLLRFAIRKGVPHSKESP